MKLYMVGYFYSKAYKSTWVMAKNVLEACKALPPKARVCEVFEVA